MNLIVFKTMKRNPITISDVITTLVLFAVFLFNRRIHNLDMKKKYESPTIEVTELEMEVVL